MSDPNEIRARLRGEGSGSGLNSIRSKLRGEATSIPSPDISTADTGCPDGSARDSQGRCVSQDQTIPGGEATRYLAELQRRRTEGTRMRTEQRAQDASAGRRARVTPPAPTFEPEGPTLEQAGRLSYDPAERLAQSDASRVDMPTVQRPRPSIGPSNAPALSREPELRPEFTPQAPGKTEQFIAAGDAFLGSLGDISLTGQGIEGVREVATNLQRKVSNLARRASGGVPIDDEEAHRIQDEIRRYQATFPKTTAASQFLGAASGIVTDIIAMGAVGRAAVPMLPQGVQSGLAAMPARARGIGGAIAGEVPVQAALAMQEQFNVEGAAAGSVLAAGLGAAFVPGGNRVRAIMKGTRTRPIQEAFNEGMIGAHFADELPPNMHIFDWELQYGDRVAEMRGFLDEKGHLDLDIADLADAGEIGPRAMRDLGRDILAQLDEHGVKVRTVGGYRISGTRASNPRQVTVAAEALRRNPEAGYLLLPSVDLSKITEPVAEWLGREFRVAGDLPVEAFNSKFTHDSWVRGQLNETTQIAREFDRQMEDAIRAGHFNTKQEAERVVNLALQTKGPAPFELVPEAMRPAVQAMRDKIDLLTQRMIDDGIVQGEMIATFDANRGFYLNRAYLAHEDPKWIFETVPPEIVNRARRYLKDQPAYRDLNRDQLDELMRRLLFEQDEAPINVAYRTGVGSKELSAMRHRLMDSVELRELYGEIQDASKNFVRSVFKMANLVGSHNFLSEARDMGLRSGWLSPEDAFKPGHTAQIAADASEVLFPLNGLHTTPEIARAFQEAIKSPPYAKSQLDAWFMKAVGATKYSKTILSPQSHVRNFVSATAFQLANGHLFNPEVFRNMQLTARTLGADVRGRGLPSTIDADLVPRIDTRPQLVDMDEMLKKFPGLQAPPPPPQKGWMQRALDGELDLKNTGDLQAFSNRMRELGIVGTSARAGELRDLYRGTLEVDDFTQYAEQFAQGPVRKLARTAETLYALEDDFHKMMGALSEYRQYRRALPEMPDAELEQLVSELIRNHYPTYPLAPSAVRKLARFPFIAPFATFSAETVRTGWNLLQRTSKEIRSTNPAIRQIGYKRALGIMLAANGTAAVAAGARELVGISRETDRDFREALPPWSRNGQIMWMGWDRETATADYIDLSYTDPYNYLKKPITALMSGADWEHSFVGAMKELGEPFVSPDIWSSAVFRTIANQDENGSPIRNTQEPANMQAADVAAYLARAMEPGFVTQGRRIGKGFEWISDDTGRAYSGTQELMAVATGMRISRVSFSDMVFFRARDLRSQLDEAGQTLREEAFKRTEQPLENITDAFGTTDTRRRELIGEFARVIRSARVSGMNDLTIEDEMIRGGLSQDLVRDLMDGVYTPYAPDDLPEEIPQEFEREDLMDQLRFDAEFQQQGDQSQPSGGTVATSDVEAIRARLRGDAN